MSQASPLLITLSPESNTPYYWQIYHQVRSAITGGKVPGHTPLPSVRSLAKSLGVSHITTEKAYMQLLAEGYVYNKPRSGYFTEPVDPRYVSQNPADTETAVRGIVRRWQENAGWLDSSSAKYNFSYTAMPEGLFPRKAWGRLLRDAALDMPEQMINEYSLYPAPTNLQKALAGFLWRTRGVQCLPEQVVVSTEWKGAVGDILGLFDRSSDRVAYENPGWDILDSDFGFDVQFVPTDQGATAYFDALAKIHPRIVFCTPSNQYYDGSIMPLSSRIQLLQTAQENDFYIVESDDGADLRYQLAPTPAIQSLDKAGRVIYLGNFSWQLSPGIRVSFFVLPPSLLERHAQLNPLQIQAVPLIFQEALAHFIADGHYERHIRKLVAELRKRHNEMLRCLEEAFGSAIDVSGAGSGLHLMVAVKNGMSQKQLLESAAAAGCWISPSDAFWHNGENGDSTLMLGFSALPPDRIPEAVDALRRAWLPAK